MSVLLLTLLLTAAPAEGARDIEDPRGFHFTLPSGFVPFPGFQPTATRERAGKLYAFGRDLGSPDAVILAIDVLEGATTPGAPSRSCGALMNSIDRTVGTPLTQRWQSVELNGLRMLMTHVFGEVLVLCVDVPLQPNALSVMVSGKPANEALLQSLFREVLSSLEGPKPAHTPLLAGLLAVTCLGALWAWRKWRRGAAS